MPAAIAQPKFSLNEPSTAKSAMNVAPRAAFIESTSSQGAPISELLRSTIDWYASTEGMKSTGPAVPTINQ